MIEGYNNKIPLYNGKTKLTTTSTPSFIYFGGVYYGGVYNTNVFKYNQANVIWEKAYNTGATSGPGGTVVNAICADLGGYVFIGAGSNATSPFPGRSLVKYDTNGNALIYATSSSSIWAMEADSQNNIILCGGGGIYKYDTNLNQIWSGTSSAQFNRLNFTTSGDIVASSTDGTVVKLNTNGTCLMDKYYTYSNIYSSCVDSNNNIWIGHQAAGSGASNLRKHDSNGNLLASYYIGPGGSSDIVYNLTADTSGYIYVNSNAYLYKVSGTGSTVWSYNPGAGGNPYTKSLVYKSGYIYFLTNSYPSFKVYDTSGTLSLSFDLPQAATINVQPI
jgi:hypothetical protein